jgi:hypothetical protein
MEGLTMKRLQGKISGVLTAGFIGFLTFGAPASAELIRAEQIIEALTAPPKSMGQASQDQIAKMTIASPIPLTSGLSDIRCAALNSATARSTP